MRNQRKFINILVDRQFQGRLLLIYLIFSLFQWIMSSYFYLRTFVEIENLALNTKEIQRQDLLDVLATEKLFVLGFCAITFLMSLLFFFIIGLRFSHRAAGVFYRISKELDSMIESKKLHKIKLRDSDFFKDIEDKFNRMVDEINEQT